MSSIVSILTSPVKLAIGTITSLMLISSCSDPAVVGIELSPGNNQIGVFFKEIKLPASMVLIDSFNTTNQNVLIVGNEVDPLFGKTVGIGYSRLFFQETEARPAADVVLDSVFFKLQVVSVNGTDLNTPKSYTVHRLTEALLDTAYYNFDKLQFESNSIASGKILFGDKKDTTVNIAVNPDFSNEVFRRIKSGDGFEDLFSFRRYLPGIAIQSKDGDNTSIGINLGVNTGFYFYYHNLGDTTAKVYRVTTASSRSFNGVISDRSGTPTSVITQRDKAYEVGSLVGMKANLGMTIKLDTSPLDSFLDSLSGVTFNQAQLILGEINTPSTGQTTLPWFIAYFIDEKNQILNRPSDRQPLTVQTDGQPQFDLDADGKEQPAINAPAASIYDADKKIFVMNVTSHLNALLRKKVTRKDWLIYGDTPYRDSPGDDFKRSFSQVLVEKDKIKIKVIYSRTR